MNYITFCLQDIYIKKVTKVTVFSMFLLLPFCSLSKSFYIDKYLLFIFSHVILNGVKDLNEPRCFVPQHDKEYLIHLFHFYVFQTRLK